MTNASSSATAALQYMHDAADDSAIVRPLDAPDIRRQVRFDPLPLLIAQPKQVPAHDPDPLPKTNQDRIVRAEKLMSSDPSLVPKAEMRYSAFVTKILLPRVVLGNCRLHLISTPRISDRFRQLHPQSSISENLGSAFGIRHAFGQR